MPLMTMNLVPRASAPILDPAAEVEYWSRQVSACVLVEELAELLGLEHDLIRRVLYEVPDNMLCLLDSPQGWTALAGYVSVELGVACADFMPAIH